jgi:uncharacterized integral membrane protein
MNEQKAPWLPVAIKYGLIIGLVSAIFIFINFLAGTFELMWVGLTVALIISIGGMVMAHREYKRLNGGYMSYGQGLMIGTVASVIAGVIGGLASYAYIEFVDPGILETMKEMQISMMEKFGMPEDQMDEAIARVNKDTTATKQLTQSLWNGLIGGFILSLIVSAFTKRNRPEFE